MPFTDDDMLKSLIERPDAFSREDESDDSRFYSKPRMVEHLDRTAMKTVTRLIGDLIVERRPRILDLMAAVDSHLPADLKTIETVGVGLNEDELKANKRLNRYIIHDLNKKNSLPFVENSFDVVLNTVSVQYLTKPLGVFADIGRILKPGGLFVVIFSNRFFHDKAVKIWDMLTDDERVRMVKLFFDRTPALEKAEIFMDMGRPRPEDDKYYHMGFPSDPIYAVFAEKKGGRSDRPKRLTPSESSGMPSQEEIKNRKALVSKNMKCPYCQHDLHKWKITENPWATWDHDLYICINDACPYVIRGWRDMFNQGNHGTSYRLVYDKLKDSFLTIPVPSLNVIKDSVEG